MSAIAPIFLRQKKCSNLKYVLPTATATRRSFSTASRKKTLAQNFRTKKQRVKCWWNWHLVEYKMWLKNKVAENADKEVEQNVSDFWFLLLILRLKVKTNVLRLFTTPTADRHQIWMNYQIGRSILLWKATYMADMAGIKYDFEQKNLKGQYCLIGS